MNKELDDATALGIGLAARLLPGVSPRTLMERLRDATGGFLDREAFGKLSACQLRPALQTAWPGITGKQVKEVLALLRGEGEAGEALAPEAGPEPGRVRVACASRTGEKIDGHFGSTPLFHLFDVGIDGVMRAGARTMEAAPEGEEGNVRRVRRLQDCHMVWMAAIGGPAAARLVRAGILPVRFAESPDLLPLLADLQRVLGHRPPPWLVKAMTRH